MQLRDLTHSCLFYRSLSYLTETQYQELSERDDALLEAIKNENYAEALECSQKVCTNLISVNIQLIW